MFDVCVRKWASAWGVGRLLPAVMGLAAGLSLALWPAFEGPLRDVPRAVRGPLGLGSAFLGVQALLLVGRSACTPTRRGSTSSTTAAGSGA